MKWHLGWAILGALVGLATGARADTAVKPSAVVPVDDFARTPDIYNAKLSPDGAFMGYVFFSKKEETVAMTFLDLKTGRARMAKVPAFDFTWVSDDRVVAEVWGGLVAVDRDSNRMTGLTGAWGKEVRKAGGARLYAHEMIQRTARDPEHVLILDRNTYFGERMLYPDVIEMNAIRVITANC